MHHPNLVPCPICGGELSLEMFAGHPWVDCGERHHLVTPREQWQDARFRQIAAEIRDYLNALDSA
jgi:hypothetical protein